MPVFEELMALERRGWDDYWGVSPICEAVSPESLEA